VYVRNACIYCCRSCKIFSHLVEIFTSSSLLSVCVALMHTIIVYHIFVAGILHQDVVMLNFFPELSDSEFSNKHEFIFVIDRSGDYSSDEVFVSISLCTFVKFTNYYNVVLWLFLVLRIFVGLLGIIVLVFEAAIIRI
jgi:hypothetical protein